MKIELHEKTLKLNLFLLRSLLLFGFYSFHIFFSTSAIAQWNKQSPIPTHLEVRGIASPTAEHIFIATADDNYDSGGALFESHNGGLSWSQRNVPVSTMESLNGIYFYDAQLGWAYGNDNYRTTDGGITWTQLPFLGSTDYMKFFSPSFGIALGNFGRMFSYDGGLSWVISSNDIFKCVFSNASTGFGLSASGIYKTIDGGITFTLAYPGNAIEAIWLDNQNAAAIVNDSILRTTNGGTTWISSGAAENKNKLFAFSSTTLISWFDGWNSDNVVAKSTDGGATWANIGTPVPEGISSGVKIEENKVVFADKRGSLFLLTNGGNNWTEVFPSRNIYFYNRTSPVFVNNLVGYYAYGDGYVIKTTDGGTSWFQVSSGAGYSVNEVDRFPNGNFVAVGDNGTLVIKKNDLWVKVPLQTYNNIVGLDVVDSLNAVASDKNGQLYVTSDAGETWSASGAGLTHFEVKDIFFNSRLEGWITGAGYINGAVFHTTDGGNTWESNTDMGGYFSAIDFNNGFGWMVSYNGTVYRTSDNGVVWDTLAEAPEYPTIYDMKFWDILNGYMVGVSGYIAKTLDGGASWQKIYFPDSEINITGIQLLSVNELWISTDNDAAYYTANGGQSWSLMPVNSGGWGYFNDIYAEANGSAYIVGDYGSIYYFAGPPPPPLNLPPVAAFSFSASSLSVQFTDLSSDADGSIIGWHWDFGDSTFSNLQNPSHTFDTANTYVVRLTVMDDDSATTTTGKIIVVQPNPGGIYGNFTEVTPLDSIFVTSQDEDFWVVATEPADYDNDGDLDVAVLGYYVVYNQSVEDRLLLLRNDGGDSLQWHFSYVNVPFYLTSSGASDLTWGDIDKDSDLDLIVGSDFMTFIYRNDNGSLVLTDTELPGYLEDNSQAYFDLKSLSLADFDNDGDNDLLIPSAIDSNFNLTTELMRNDGVSTSGGFIFTKMDSIFAPTSHAQSTWADFDDDADLDLLLINISPFFDNSYIKRYRNDGNGVFVEENILGTLTIEHGEGQWGDYDGDGDLDILIAGHIKDIDGLYKTVLRVYRNDSTTFVPSEVIECIPCVGWFDITAATWADYNSDGKMDILVAGTYNSGSQIEGRSKIYINNNNGTFSDSGNDLPAPGASGDRGGTFSWLDLDNDGDLDYFIAGQYFVPGGNGLIEAQMHAYRNDTEGENNSPTQPSGLNTVVNQNNSIVLSWDAATDDHTPSAALTYDLQIFQNNIPMTLPRRLPVPGNVSAANEWQLSGLQDGHYKWTLRAVDAAYIGSEIATGEFSIGVSNVDDGKVPEVYSLAQNYPNPFNPATGIRYSLPKEGLVTIKIYNALGEEVKTLVNEFTNAGNYEVRFDASELTSGIYFYRIESGSFRDTKKMLLLK